MTAGHGSTTIVVTRLFDAPPSAVFEAWTKTEHVAHWWDPSVSVPEHPLQVPCGVSLVLTSRGAVLAVLRDTQSRHQGRGNVVILKGFPKSGERVESHKAWVSPPLSSQSKHASSFFTQRRHGMDVRGALGRDKACCQPNHDNSTNCSCQCDGVSRLQPVQHRSRRISGRDCHPRTGGQANSQQNCSVPQHHPQDVAAIGSECHAHADSFFRWRTT